MNYAEFKTQMQEAWVGMLIIIEWPAWMAQLYVELSFDDRYGHRKDEK